MVIVLPWRAYRHRGIYLAIASLGSRVLEERRLIQKSRRCDRSVGLNTIGWSLGEYFGTNSPALSDREANASWLAERSLTMSTECGTGKFFENSVGSFRLELSGAFLIRVAREERGQKRTRQYRCENSTVTKVASVIPLPPGFNCGGELRDASYHQLQKYSRSVC